VRGTHRKSGSGRKALSGNRFKEPGGSIRSLPARAEQSLCIGHDPAQRVERGGGPPACAPLPGLGLCVKMSNGSVPAVASTPEHPPGKALMGAVRTTYGPFEERVLLDLPRWGEFRIDSGLVLIYSEVKLRQH
jgi:hypothetical protein